MIGTFRFKLNLFNDQAGQAADSNLKPQVEVDRADHRATVLQLGHTGPCGTTVREL